MKRFAKMREAKSAEEWTAEQFELIPDNVPEELFKKVVRAIQADVWLSAADLVLSAQNNNLTQNELTPNERSILELVREKLEAEAAKLEGKQ